MSKKWYYITEIIFIVINIFITLILLDIFKNTFFLFQGGLGIIAVVLGYIGIIVSLKAKEIGRKLKVLSAVLIVFFSLLYIIIDPEAKYIFYPICILEFVDWILLITVIKKITKKTDYNSQFIKGKYFKVNRGTTLYIMFIIILLSLIWFYPFENNLNIFEGPNGEGVTSYINETDSPNLSINIDGGFIYNVFGSNAPINKKHYIEDDRILGVLDLKLNKPNATIKIIPFKKGIIIINFINYNNNSIFKINGEKYVIEENEDNFKERSINSTDEQIIGDLVKNSYLDSYSSHYIYLELDNDKEYNIEIISNNNSKEEWMFYHLSDLHGGINVMVPIFREFLMDNPEFMIVNGDLVNNGYKSEYMIISELLHSYPLPIYTSIGNHDVWGLGQEYYPSFFGPYYYSFVYNNATFIIFDTSTGIIGESQFKWIEQELEQVSTDLVFLISHMAPINTVTGVFDDNINFHPESNLNIHSKAESEKILRMCKQYEVDYYFAGHSHIYGEQVIDGTGYITSGVLGGTAKDKNDIGFLKVSINGNDVTVKFIDSSNYYNVGVLKQIQTIKVFLIPLLRGSTIRLLITLVLFIVNYIFWLIFRKRIIYIKE